MMRQRRMRRYSGLAGATTALLMLSLAGCANVPPAGAELSRTVGARILALESAHVSAVRAFFDAKRAQAREFMQDVWIPRFIDNYLSSTDVAAMLAKTCDDEQRADCLHAILIVSKQAQLQIQNRYREILDPLAETEKAVLASVRASYTDVERRVTILTALLSSAADVQAQRRAVLSEAGINESRIADALAAVSDLLGKVTADAAALDARLASYRKAMAELRQALQGATDGGP